MCVQCFICWSETNLLIERGSSFTPSLLFWMMRLQLDNKKEQYRCPDYHNGCCGVSVFIYSGFVLEYSKQQSYETMKKYNKTTKHLCNCILNIPVLTWDLNGNYTFDLWHHKGSENETCWWRLHWLHGHSYWRPRSKHLSNILTIALSYLPLWFFTFFLFTLPRPLQHIKQV